MKKAFALLLAGFTLLAATSGANGQQGVWNIITRPVFEDMLKHRRDSGCQGAFYTYDAFIEAASKFPGFGTTGNDETRRRELAAFFGQTSHETTGTACTLYCSSVNNLSTVLRSSFGPRHDCMRAGGWATAPDGQFAWGYCRVNEQNPTDPPYYGRGPIQLTQ
jgi:basic endochitinase B